MHLIIDTEIINAAPVEVEGDHLHPLPFGNSEEGDDPAAASALKLLQEELLPRLFSGVAPQLPPSQGAGESHPPTTTTTRVQMRKSVGTLDNEVQPLTAGCAMGTGSGSCDDAADTIAAAVFQTRPPSVLRVRPVAVYRQPLTLPSLASPPETASDSSISGSWITVWLQLSAPLPTEGVTLLARHRGCLLETQVERSDDQFDNPTIKVGVFRSTSVESHRMQF